MQSSRINGKKDFIFLGRERGIDLLSVENEGNGNFNKFWGIFNKFQEAFWQFGEKSSTIFYISVPQLINSQL